jgi:hypothetical protein
MNSPLRALPKDKASLTINTTTTHNNSRIMLHRQKSIRALQDHHLDIVPQNQSMHRLQDLHRVTISLLQRQTMHLLQDPRLRSSFPNSRLRAGTHHRTMTGQ